MQLNSIDNYVQYMFLLTIQCICIIFKNAIPDTGTPSPHAFSNLSSLVRHSLTMIVLIYCMMENQDSHESEEIYVDASLTKQSYGGLNATDACP